MLFTKPHQSLIFFQFIRHYADIEFVNMIILYKRQQFALLSQISKFLTCRAVCH